VLTIVFDIGIGGRIVGEKVEGCLLTPTKLNVGMFPKKMCKNCHF